MTTTIIFDLGGVLIDWNPRYLYNKIFSDKKRMEYFLSEICNMEWNVKQDGGRSFAEGTSLLIAQFPAFKNEILAFHERWTEMLGGPIGGTVAILEELHQKGEIRLISLTNWSAETFPFALARFDFLQLFEDILVSGVEKMKKPDPEIYRLLLDRYNIDKATAIFIDDNKDNIKAAQNLGIESWLFTSAEDLRHRLEEQNIL